MSHVNKTVRYAPPSVLQDMILRLRHTDESLTYLAYVYSFNPYLISLVNATVVEEGLQYVLQVTEEINQNLADICANDLNETLTKMMGKGVEVISLSFISFLLLGYMVMDLLLTFFSVEAEAAKIEIANELVSTLHFMQGVPRSHSLQTTHTHAHLHAKHQPREHGPKPAIHQTIGSNSLAILSRKNEGDQCDTGSRTYVKSDVRSAGDGDMDDGAMRINRKRDPSATIVGGSDVMPLSVNAKDQTQHIYMSKISDLELTSTVQTKRGSNGEGGVRGAIAPASSDGTTAGGKLGQQNKDKSDGVTDDFHREHHSTANGNGAVSRDGNNNNKASDAVYNSSRNTERNTSHEAAKKGYQSKSATLGLRSLNVDLNGMSSPSLLSTPHGSEPLPLASSDSRGYSLLHFGRRHFTILLCATLLVACFGSLCLTVMLNVETSQQIRTASIQLHNFEVVSDVTMLMRSVGKELDASHSYLRLFSPPVPYPTPDPTPEQAYAAEAFLQTQYSQTDAAVSALKIHLDYSVKVGDDLDTLHFISGADISQILEYSDSIIPQWRKSVLAKSATPVETTIPYRSLNRLLLGLADEMLRINLGQEPSFLFSYLFSMRMHSNFATQRGMGSLLILIGQKPADDPMYREFVARNAEFEDSRECFLALNRGPAHTALLEIEDGMRERGEGFEAYKSMKGDILDLSTEMLDGPPDYWHMNCSSYLREVQTKVMAPLESELIAMTNCGDSDNQMTVVLTMLNVCLVALCMFTAYLGVTKFVKFVPMTGRQRSDWRVQQEMARVVGFRRR